MVIKESFNTDAMLTYDGSYSIDQSAWIPTSGGFICIQHTIFRHNIEPAFQAKHLNLVLKVKADNRQILSLYFDLRGTRV